MPITAASLAPLIVKLTCFSVPSIEVTVKVSTLLSRAPSYCTALFADRVGVAAVALQAEAAEVACVPRRRWSGMLDWPVQHR